MPRGIIKFAQPGKGFGFIVPDDGSEDIYFKAGSDTDTLVLHGGVRVEYAVARNDRGQPVAVDLSPLQSPDAEVRTTSGTVKFWDPEKGFGFVANDGGGKDIYLARRSTLFKDGQIPAERDKVIVEYVESGEKNPLGTSVQITELAPWKPSGIALFDYADVGNRLQMIDLLAGLAEDEVWDHRREPTGGRPILDSYLRYTFVRLQEEGKVCTNATDSYSAFNTGLVTPLQEEIFALFTKNATPNRQLWQFLGFRKRSDRTVLEYFGHSLPELANYFDDPTVLLYDRRLQLHINIDHVLEHLERFPEPLNSNDFLARQSIQAAEVNTRSRVYRNYKSAIPQWYRDPHSAHASVQLLLPLCLRQPDKADLALVVERVGDAYRGNTVLTLDMAYKNARLLARPDSDWLVP